MGRLESRLMAFVWVSECLLLGATAVPILHVHAEDAQALTGPALSARLAPPVKDGLELWVKSDDLTGLRDWELVGTWPDSSDTPGPWHNVAGIGECTSDPSRASSAANVVES